MSNFTPRTSDAYPKNMHTYKTFTQYVWNHLAPETAGNCTWFAFGETSRIVQECKNDESYNIQYGSGNEFMSRSPNALLWLNNATNKGAWHTEGDTRGDFDPATSSIAGTLITVQPGDILCYWASDGYGHVEIVEKISGGNVYCSGSKAAARQPAVFYYDRIVASSQFKVGQRHYFTGYDADGNSISWSNDYFQGIIRNPYVTEQGDTTVPEINISPTSYSKIMSPSQDYLDFQFTITITGIPEGEIVSGGNSYPGLDRVQNTGWSYTNYTVGGNTYRRATKTQTLRYNKEYNYAYSTTKYMYYNLTFDNGSISSQTPMHIDVRASSNSLIPIIFKGVRKRKRYNIQVK